MRRVRRFWSVVGLIMLFLLPRTANAFLQPWRQRTLPISHTMMEPKTGEKLLCLQQRLSCRRGMVSKDSETKLTDTHATSHASSACTTSTSNTSSPSSNPGFLVLCTVPMVWGTYVPVVRGMYEIEPPVPGFVFSASYLLVAAISCLTLLGVQWGSNKEASRSLPIKGGIELGMYTFLANSLQVIGLETVPSDRAGFLIQLTTIFVPLVSALLDRDLGAVSARTWMACLVALSGIAVMGLDNAGSSLDAMSLAPTLSKGDTMILGAALLYTMHVVRLGYYANTTTPLRLATAKSVVQSVLSSGLVASLVALSSIDTGVNVLPILTMAQSAGHEILQFFDAFASNVNSGDLSMGDLSKIAFATLWSGVIGTAYVLYAQSFGQQNIKPSDANLVYSLQPIFTAIFAYALLGETMDTFGYIGGALILTAVLMVTSKPPRAEGEKLL